MRELFDSKSILLGAPTDWWDPSSFTQGLAAMQWCGLWAMPGIQKAIGDDFGVVAWPAFSSSVGKPRPSPAAGARWSAPRRATSRRPRRSSSGCGSTTPLTRRTSTSATASTSRRGKSLAAKAEKLQAGPASDALKIFNESAVAANPAWTPKMGNAYADAATAIVRKGGDIDANLAKAEKAVDAELQRLFG